MIDGLAPGQNCRPSAGWAISAPRRARIMQRIHGFSRWRAACLAVCKGVGFHSRWVMSVSSIGSSTAYPLKSVAQSDTTDGGDPPTENRRIAGFVSVISDDPSSVPSSSSAADDGSATTTSSQLSADVLSALFSLQGSQSQSGASDSQSMFSKWDSDSDGDGRDQQIGIRNRRSDRTPIRRKSMACSASSTPTAMALISKMS